MSFFAASTPPVDKSAVWGASEVPMCPDRRVIDGQRPQLYQLRGIFALHSCSCGLGTNIGSATACVHPLGGR